ncbi:MAG: DNA translocase FtsK 4TM domain-containing protein [Eubacteriales bacterium]|jgi:S-DNA-T family DNA segregation ATPase FtsK/SpoIIIE
MLENELKSELCGIAVITFALLSLVSLFTHAVGAFGQFLNQCLSVAAGQGRLLIPALFFLLGIKIIRERSKVKLDTQITGTALLMFLILSFIHLSIPVSASFNAGQKGEGGGILGAAGSYLLLKYFDVTGSYIILFSLMVISIVLLTKLPVSRLFSLLGRYSGTAIKKAYNKITDFIFIEVKEEKEETAEPQANTLIIKNDENAPVFLQSVLIQGKKAGGKTQVINSETPINTVSEKSGRAKAKQQTFSPSTTSDGKTFCLPPTSLLNWKKNKEHTVTDKEINEKIRILEETLASFGINVRVTQVTVGPAITRYEIQPPTGIKVSRIIGLSDDLSLALAASHVRIEAPIPGKAAIGIEVPNKEISTVHMKELVESKEFGAASSRVAVALGKDISGTPIVTDLSQMPHLLIAGATGSGKSVCINTMVASILFKATPEEVKIILIDPKMVELTNYNGIPHLITPVVTNPKKASGILHWAVKEMEQRYDLFAAVGAKDINRYNKIQAELQKGFHENELPDRSEDATQTLNSNGTLPLILIIIDELSDLMMIAPAEVEDSICRLAQMARAAGIHLVLATQRPSVDVITGLIKANIPSRISFAVSSQMDSRTILDTGGAEKLLGRGDMLFFPVGSSKPARIQGAFLADKDTENLVSFLKEQAQPNYNPDMANVTEEENISFFEQDDNLLPQAVQLFIEQGNASVSMLQRRFHIGYARAARLVDIMEQRGIVGSFEGSKPRSILMTLEQFQQSFKQI